MWLRTICWISAGKWDHSRVRRSNTELSTLSFITLWIIIFSVVKMAAPGESKRWKRSSSPWCRYSHHTQRHLLSQWMHVSRYSCRFLLLNLTNLFRWLFCVIIPTPLNCFFHRNFHFCRSTSAYVARRSVWWLCVCVCVVSILFSFYSHIVHLVWRMLAACVGQIVHAASMKIMALHWRTRLPMSLVISE